MLLAHEFYDRKFLLPDRLTAKQREQQARKNGEEAAETTATGELMTQGLRYFRSCVVLWASIPKTICPSQIHVFAKPLELPILKFERLKDMNASRLRLRSMSCPKHSRVACLCQMHYGVGEQASESLPMREAWCSSLRRGCMTATPCCWISTHCTHPSSECFPTRPSRSSPTCIGPHICGHSFGGGTLPNACPPKSYIL